MAWPASWTTGPPGWRRCCRPSRRCSGGSSTPWRWRSAPPGALHEGAPVNCPFDLVVFGLDGTLADTLPDITAALNMTLAEAGLRSLPQEEVMKYVGDGSAKLIERALPDSEGHRN